MKLAEHVQHLRTLITKAFDKQMSRLGFGPNGQIDLDKIPPEFQGDRQRFEELLESHIEETGSYQEARDKLIDELTFTLFNRIAAVKVMEAAKLFPPIITKEPEHGDRSFGHKAWLEIRPDMRSEDLEGIREYIQHAFNELGDTLPLYSKGYPYAMLPDPISLNEIIEGFNEVDEDPDVEEDIWESDDVLGWLYESYNNEKKEEFKDSGNKTEYDRVYLQSQVYTPRWVVKFLIDNSLGKLYLEMYPDSEIKQEYEIANAPETRIREPKPLPEIKLIDPACGSGNFLLYAFDLLYDLYIDQAENYGAGYGEEEIPRLIIEHNLHGIDIDDRSTQLAQLGLYIKARKKRNDIGELHYQVVSSAFFLPDYEEVKHIFEANTTLDKHQKALIAEIWSDLQNAYKFGSLIRLDEKLKSRLRELVSRREEKQEEMFSDEELGVEPEPVQRELFLEQDIEREQKFAEIFFENLKAAVRKYARVEGSSFLTSKTQDAILFLELLTEDYDVATANPPYTNRGDFGPKLKKFIESNYKDPINFHTNLYAAFIKKCFEISNKNGKICLIHPRTFMFIKTFEDTRKFIIENTHINFLVDFSLSNLFGSIMVDPAFYVLEKGIYRGRESWFVSLDQYTRTPEEKYKKKYCLQALSDYIIGKDNQHNFELDQTKLKVVETWPFIFWISDEFRDKFKEKSIDDFMTVCKGLTTANNHRFLRYHWEIDSEKISIDYKEDKKKWVRFSKGGPYNKWYGNFWLVVNWENNGWEIKHFFDSNGKLRSRPQNEKYYFKEGITGSFSGSKGITFRKLPVNFITEGASGGIFFDKGFDLIFYTLGYLNSKLSFYIANCLNSTVTTEVGDLKRIPFYIPKQEKVSRISHLSSTNTKIKKYLCSYSLVEFNYKSTPVLYANAHSLRNNIKEYLNYENHLITKVLINEAIINMKLFEFYELNDHDKDMVISQQGKSVGSLPVISDAKNAYIVEEKANDIFPISDIKKYVENLPTKKVTQDEKAEIINNLSILYQKNNDLEEFCVRNHINPINVWYWFRESDVIPVQRMNTIVMEFLADMIREILMEDEDGIIPLVSNAGEEVLLARIEDKFREKGLSMAQVSQFDSLLGRPLAEYLDGYFFEDLSDHLNLFMYLPRTPFIWHLTSGPERGFECYLIIYKWSRDNLMRIRSVYIEQRERALINRQSDLNGNESAEAQHERDKIYKQLQEIDAFKEKIDELLGEGYDPILDDGVGKNIAPLQEKGMLPYHVLTDSQLKTYLNADW